MTHFSRYITAAASSAFILASFFNSKLVWNLEQFDAPEQEIVFIDEKPYSINKEYNAEVKVRHTDKISRKFYQQSHEGNVKALTDFFNLVR